MMKKLLLMLPLLSVLVAPLSIQQQAFAASQAQSSACAGLTQLGSAQDCNSGKGAVNGLIKTAVDIITYLVGIIAIIMIVISGIKFATSGGDAGKVKEARGALLWALAGIAVVALAQVIVYWVLNTSSSIH